jgi:hypothetical protein
MKKFSSTLFFACASSVLSTQAAVRLQATLKYGTGFSCAAILTALGNNELNTVNGYHPSDFNMDGVVKYQGPGNDRHLCPSVNWHR